MHRKTVQYNAKHYATLVDERKGSLNPSRDKISKLRRRKVECYEKK